MEREGNMYSKKSAKQKLWNARSIWHLLESLRRISTAKIFGYYCTYCMCKLYLSKNVCLWLVKSLILPTFLFTEILLLVKRNLFYVRCSVAIHKKSSTQDKVTLCSRSLPISRRTNRRTYWLSTPYCEEKHTNLGEISQSIYWEIFCVKRNITHMGTHP